MLATISAIFLRFSSSSSPPLLSPSMAMPTRRLLYPSPLSAIEFEYSEAISSGVTVKKKFEAVGCPSYLVAAAGAASFVEAFTRNS
nr:hypothetical protein Iba_chr08eCG5020 [Ipomoea batatas]